MSPMGQKRRTQREQIVSAMPEGSPEWPASASGLTAVAYHCDHLRALAQRVEVVDREVRIIGSKALCFRGRRSPG